MVSGKMPAQATAKSVMASGERLIDVRIAGLQEKNGGDQRAGMAESDPPDEIDDGESQPTGMLMPQIPTPLMISQAREIVSTITMVKEIANPATHSERGGPCKKRWR